MSSGGPPAPGMGTRAAASGRPAAAAARRRRPANTGSAATGSGGGGAQQGGAQQGGNGGASNESLSARETLRFYTDDAPGLKIGPTMVLVLSLMFIGIVVLLHIWGKMTGTSPK